MRTLDELADEIFGLSYYSQGALTFPLDRAPPRFRARFAERLIEAKRREKEEIEAARRGR